MGRVPVILSDAWVAPDGPAWEEFSIRIPERQLDEVPRLLETYASRFDLMGVRAVKPGWNGSPPASSFTALPRP